MFYFYVLLSGTDNKHYYGSTTDLRRRFQEHVQGKAPATKYRRPLRLVYYEAYEQERAARLREMQVKKSSSIRKALQKRLYTPTVGQPGLPQGSRVSSSAG